jgi:hypothetical protein
MSATFEQLAEDKVGTIYIDRFDKGLRIVVLRGPASLCAYIGVPVAHPLAGEQYDNLPIECHGGLTFAGEGATEKNCLPPGHFYYGWDYSHCDDAAFYDLQYRDEMRGKRWTVAEVEGELWMPAYQMKRLMKMAENIFAKGAGWRKP